MQDHLIKIYHAKSNVKQIFIGCSAKKLCNHFNYGSLQCKSSQKSIQKCSRLQCNMSFKAEQNQTYC